MIQESPSVIEPMRFDRFFSRFEKAEASGEIGTSLSRGELLHRLEMLILEARKKVEAFAQGRTEYIGYIRDFRNRAQHCLVDIGRLAQEDLRELAALDLSISEGLQAYYNEGVFNDFQVKDGNATDFLRLQNEYNQAMPAKIQRMIKLLDRVRDKMLNSTAVAVSGRLIRPFPTPEGNSWPDLAIRFTSDFQVEITAAQIKEIRTYTELGFEDRRGKDNPKPDQNWETLRTFAYYRGAIHSTKEAKDWSKLEKCVQTINDRLKPIFGLSENPIEYDRKAKVYKVLLKLTPPPH